MKQEQRDHVTIEKHEVKKPSMYKVVMLNDDFTPMEFVVHVLMKFFKKGETDAVRIMLNVHQSGRGIAGIYTKEIAETKSQQVNDYAKSFEFPLQCICEKE